MPRRRRCRTPVTLGSTATIIATTRAGGGVGVLSPRAVAADIASGELVAIAASAH